VTPEIALRKAGAAERIYKDPIVQETLETMEREVMEAWMNCPVRDVEAREALWRMAVTTRKFRDMLRGTMESGKLAADQIARTNEQKSFIQKQKERFFADHRR
jgi:hypothetical protein